MCKLHLEWVNCMQNASICKFKKYNTGQVHVYHNKKLGLFAGGLYLYILQIILNSTYSVIIRLLHGLYEQFAVLGQGSTICWLLVLAQGPHWSLIQLPISPRAENDNLLTPELWSCLGHQQDPEAEVAPCPGLSSPSLPPPTDRSRDTTCQSCIQNMRAGKLY